MYKSVLVSLICIAGGLTSVSFGQPAFGVGIGVSSLGAQIQGAVTVMKYANIRGGFNDFKYSTSFDKDGTSYQNGTLNLRSTEITWDQFFPHARSLHISGGALVFNDNSGSASTYVSPSQSFSLGNASYISGGALNNNTVPVSGTATIGFHRVAPMLLIGYGNLLPRSSRHFSINIEAGVVFEGSPSVKLNLTGTACANFDSGCVNAATDPGVQANVVAEQNKLSNDLSPFKYYPVISLVFGYKIH